MRYTIVLFCCVLIMACEQAAVAPVSGSDQPKLAQQRTVKPGAAVQLQHRVTSEVTLAEPVTIELNVSSTSPPAEVQVQLKLDDNLTLLSDRSEWQLSLDADNNPATLPVSVSLQSGEEAFINVFVTVTSAAGDRKRSFVVPVRLPEAERAATEKSKQKKPDMIEMPAEETVY